MVKISSSVKNHPISVFLKIVSLPDFTMGTLNTDLLLLSLNGLKIRIKIDDFFNTNNITSVVSQLDINIVWLFRVVQVKQKAMRMCVGHA